MLPSFGQNNIANAGIVFYVTEILDGNIGTV